MLLSATLCTSAAQAQQPFQTDAVGPERFIAVHGRKAVVMGYATSGLEAWAYPLQLVSGYSIGFRSAGDTTEVIGTPLLRRITYEPQAVTRTYIGPDFIVRERLFVPLNEQAVLLNYTVECHHPVDIVIHFTPVLDLMWPLSLGGQSAQWNPTASAYVLTDGRQTYSAVIGSPNLTSHDETRNSIEPGALGNRLAFAMRAGGGRTVTVVVAKIKPGAAAQRINDLIRDQPALEVEARDHYTSVAADALRITTPDPALNQQLSWAQAALDQAWVCNPVLGCGLVAGYGPSRNARRPQYDWFFAGDALIAVEALLSTGAYDRAGDALAFIAKYQDSRTGMIWHEMSQSADPADWATRYPYMFVHVDITFQYLIAVEHYVSASGDTGFLREHWAGIDAAYRYCASLLNSSDGLPRIPTNKEGVDEQDKITDDLDLSVSWVAASSAFSRMARLNGHGSEAEDASRASERARSAAATHYWDEARRTWIDGYNEAGGAIVRRGTDGVRLVSGGILDQPRSDLILDQLASADFQTDWGTRGVATSSTQFDPSSYAKGSVSAKSTAGIAAAFWSQHRPVTALSIWSGLLPWGTLDSMGHMHELLAGDFYHQQAESVPEQTWSSAAFLSSTVHGLLGLTTDAETNKLAFAPHLPPSWQEISVDNIKVSGGKVTFRLSRVPGGLALTAENSGAPLELRFQPEIPLGAHLLGAEWDGRSIKTESEAHPQDTHASITVRLSGGTSQGLIRYTGGVSVSVAGTPPLVGESSQSIKLTSVILKGNSLVLGADVPQPLSPASSIILRTQEIPRAVREATLSLASPGVYRLAVATPATQPYEHVQITVELADRAGN